ncbi:DUF748 domain-containing protein [Piscinibacter aquaticus]|uniref:DUF748 domain-containing protein n=1 Tax=Piscinibacter aquaticus TaxID=392597 RepID=A0A5C6TXQ0_9BURK|nr:DUF748 domain-containing protein [Piscinibacter aquaticus]
MNRSSWWIVVIVVAVLAAGALGALRLGASRLEAALHDALGPRASIGAVRIGLTGVQIDDLRIGAAPSGWPAADELVARRVHIRPSLASLWSHGWHIASIEVEDGYLSLLRTRQGKLRVLPALLEKPRGDPASGEAPRVRIADVALREVAIDFFDASVRGPTHKLRFESLRADVGPLAMPAFDEPTAIDLAATLKGPQKSGHIAIDGTVTIATLDAKLKAAVRGVDLVALQPYLLKVNEAGVKRGTLDLTLDASVKAKRLHAPGRVTLTGLELASGSGVLATFGGVPRQAVLSAMEREGRIEVGFTLEGRLDDPAFSINDNLATKLAGGLAESLGVSLGGVVEGVGSVIKGLLGR